MLISEIGREQDSSREQRRLQFLSGKFHFFYLKNLKQICQSVNILQLGGLVHVYYIFLYNYCTSNITKEKKKKPYSVKDFIYLWSEGSLRNWFTKYNVLIFKSELTNSIWHLSLWFLGGLPSGWRLCFGVRLKWCGMWKLEGKHLCTNSNIFSLFLQGCLFYPPVLKVAKTTIVLYWEHTAC